MRNFILIFFCLQRVICLYGQEFEWVKSLGGSNTNFSPAVVHDFNGNIYYLTYFLDTIDADPGPSVLEVISSEQVDFCISKVNAEGELIWVKKIEGTGSQIGYDMTLNQDNDQIYISGLLNGSGDFDPGPGVHVLTSVANADMFVLKLDTAGNFIWANRLGHSDVDLLTDICVDTDNNFYITGEFSGTVDFDPGAGVTSLSGSDDAFFAKYNSDGNLIWVKKVGGTTTEVYSYSITTDSSGNLYSTGMFVDGTVDFDPGPGSYNLSSVAMSEDIFLLKLDTDGNFVWARKFGGNSPDKGIVLKVDEAGNVYTSGYFAGTVDFDPGASTYNLAAIGSTAAYLLKLNSAGNFQWAQKIGSVWGDQPTAILLDSSHVYTLGVFLGSCDFNAGPSTNIATSNGGKDIFMLKLDTLGNFIWNKTWGGTGNDVGNDFVYTPDKEIYMVGLFDNTVDFNEGPGINLITATDYMHVFIHKQSSDTAYVAMNQIGCNSYTVPSGDETYFVNGIYSDTILSDYGITTVLTINLTFGTPNSSSFSTTNCTAYTVPSGDETYYASALITDTITNLSGCDSIMTINLTIIPPVYSTIFVEECSSYTVPSGDETHYSSGTYSDTIPSSLGCDSIITIQLAILNSTEYLTINNICDSMVSPSGLYVYSIDGVYSDTIPNVAGCDSIISLALDLNYSSNSFISITQCSQYLSPGGNIINSSGNYTEVIMNSAGCDSTINLDVTINQPTTSEIYVDACEEYVSPSGDYTWYFDGDYTDIISNTNGCDSVIVIHLNVNYVNNSISLTANATLVAHETSSLATFQWLACDSNYAQITGETQDYFIATDNGVYAVEVTSNGCVDTSMCYAIYWLNSENSFGGYISIFPNPNNGNFTLKSLNQSVLSLTITNALGEIIFATNDVQNEYEFSLPDGMYYIVYSTESGYFTEPLIITE